MSALVPLAPDVHVLVRGWLHGNCVLLAGARPALIDSGYHTGVADLIEVIEQTLGVVPAGLADIALTHVHSDHAGGIAALQAAGVGTVHAHPDAAALTDPWDPVGLWLADSGQEMPPFTVDALLQPGVPIALGERSFEVIHTPGHATGGVGLFCAEEGWLVTGDALWEDGFGMLNPWTDGPEVFDQAAAALDRIEAVRPTLVIPGHGHPFADVAGALARSRSRLAYLRAHPEALVRQAIRVGAAFLAMARPAEGPRELRERLLVFARTRGADAALVDGILGELAARRERASSR